MESLYILIPIALFFVVLAVGIFLWAVRSDQFEDLERKGMDVLLDDKPAQKHQRNDDAR